MVSLFIISLFHSDNYTNIFIKFGSIASTVVATWFLKDGCGLMMMIIVIGVLVMVDSFHQNLLDDHQDMVFVALDPSSLEEL
jgi:hypothetical protein